MSEVCSGDISIAFLCDRLGPYHVARLNAANKHADITAIEFSAMDQTYAWNCVDHAGGFQRVTLFSDKPITEQPSSLVVKRVRTVLEKLRPRVVAISGWDAAASLIALWWCLETKTPTILISDSQAHDEQRVWWKEAVKRRIVRLHSAGFVGGSSHAAYLKSLGMPEKRIVSGVDVVDNGYFAAGAEAARQNAASLRIQFSLPEHYFLVSSRFVLKKNLSAILRAYAIYRQSAGSDAWKLVMLGDGPLKTEILRLVEELGLVDSVLMPGFKQYEELPAYYGLSGAFILGSTSEQWGLVVNEAMATGLPVLVSSPCGCVPDLMAHGQNGYVFEPHDSNELSRLLSFMASPECNREALGNAGRSVIEKWNLATHANSLCKAAEMALNAPRPAFGGFDKMLLLTLIHRRRSSSFSTGS